MYPPNPPATQQGLAPFGEWFSETFRLWGARWQIWVLQGLIFFCICVLPGALGYVVFFVSMIATGSANNRSSTPDATMLVGMGIMYAFFAIGGLFALALIPGMINTALKQIRGQETRVADIFSGMRYFWGALLVGIVAGLGLLACCVGVFVTNGLVFLALPLMIDKNMRATEAISLSWRTGMKNIWLYVFYAFIVGLLAQLGGSACYIGLIATISFLPIGQAVAYVRTFEGPALNGGLPGILPPPYQASPPPVHTPSPSAPASPRCYLCGAVKVEGVTRCPQCGASWEEKKAE